MGSRHRVGILALVALAITLTTVTILGAAGSSADPGDRFAASRTAQADGPVYGFLRIGDGAPARLGRVPEPKASEATNAVVTILDESFDSPTWPNGNPLWVNFDGNRNTFSSCGPAGPAGSRDCDFRWGGGVKVLTPLHSSMAGRTLAWPAAGGSDKLSPFTAVPDASAFRIPKPVNSWMVFGPFSLADAVTATLEYYFLSDIVRKGPSGAFTEFQFVGVSIDGDLFFGEFCCSSSQFSPPGFTRDLLDLMNQGGFANRNQVWFAINVRTDSSTAVADQRVGSYIDDLRIRKQVGTPPVRQVFVPLGLDTNDTVLPPPPAPPTPSVTIEPLVRNGSFETNDFTSWAQEGVIAKSVSTQQTHTPTVQGRVAILGNPAFKCNAQPLPQPNQAAIIQQQVNVPATGAPKLRFWYRLFSEDRVDSSGSPQADPSLVSNPNDSFDVFILDGPNQNRVLRDGVTLQEASEDRCDNSAARNSIRDLGWKQKEVDLNAYKGKTITISFETWNRKDNLFNTYVYLDDVEVVG